MQQELRPKSHAESLVVYREEQLRGSFQKMHEDGRVDVPHAQPGNEAGRAKVSFKSNQREP